MKAQQYIAGVLLIALLVAGAILTMGNLLSSQLNPNLPVEIAAEAETGQLPSMGDFQVDLPLSGKVVLSYTATGTLFDSLTPPPVEEAATLPDLGTLNLGFLLHRSGESVDGFVDIGTTLVFTGYYTIDTTVLTQTKSVVVGPQLDGSYANGVLDVVSQRVAYVTDAGETLERQFRLTGTANATPGLLTGEYRETVWGFGLQPYTVVGTFELKDLLITTAAANRPPVVDSLALTAQFDTAITVHLIAGDTEGSPLTYSIVQPPSHGALSGTAPDLTYTPNSGFAGIDSFTFKANDGAADSPTESVSLRVLAAPGQNNAPSADAKTVNAVTAQAQSITLTGSDPDNDALTFIIVNQPAHGTLSGTAPNLSYTANGDFAGTDSFTFKVNDGTVDSGIATVSINVTSTPINTPPTATDQSVNAVQGQGAAITLAGSDPEANPLSFILVSQPSHGTLSGTAPNLSYTANGDFTGSDSFTFKVNDGAFDSPAATVTINVTAIAVNTPPTAADQGINAVQGQATAITLSGSDAEATALTFIVVSQPSHGTLSGNAPNLSYSSNSDFVGSDSFTFKVNDGAADSAVATVTINVTAPTGGNSVPTANAQAVTTAAGQATAITLQGADVDSNPLTFIIVDQPANGTLSGTAPNLTYTPNLGFAGTDSFTYKVNDGTADSATVTVTIEVKTVTPTDEGSKIYLPVTKK